MAEVRFLSINDTRRRVVRQKIYERKLSMLPIGRTDRIPKGYRPTPKLLEALDRRNTTKQQTKFQKVTDAKCVATENTLFSGWDLTFGNLYWAYFGFNLIICSDVGVPSTLIISTNWSTAVSPANIGRPNNNSPKTQPADQTSKSAEKIE